MGGLGCDNMTVIIVCFLQGGTYEELCEKCSRPSDSSSYNGNNSSPFYSWLWSQCGFFSFYCQCDHFSIKNSVSLAFQACFRMEELNRRRDQHFRNWKHTSCSEFLTAQENTNKNDSLVCPMLGRVNCAEMEFQALVGFQDFFIVILRG